MLSLEAFVQEHTVLGAAPLVPEIVLHLARDADGIFGAGDTLPREIERFPPY